MELPNYRLAWHAKNVGAASVGQSKGFSSAGHSRLFSSRPLWSGSLQTFDLQLNVVADSQRQHSWRSLAGFIAPVFEPLGFGDWRSFHGTCSRISWPRKVWSPRCRYLFGSTRTAPGGADAAGVVASLLAFCLLYTPCVAAIASVRNGSSAENGRLGVVVGQCAIAWIAAFSGNRRAF